MTGRAPTGEHEERAQTSRELRGHFRGKPRPGRRVDVSYEVAPEGPDGFDGPDRVEPRPTPVRAVTKNIGIGGAFILTTDPAPPGSKVIVRLAVKTGSEPIEVRAEVRWIVDGKHEEPEAEFGMGVKFGALEVEQLLQLNEYFASLTLAESTVGAPGPFDDDGL